MRISGGTIILVIVLLPFLVPFVYYVSSFIKSLSLPNIGVPRIWFTEPYFILYNFFLYLRNFLADPRILAVLLGLGLIIASISSTK